MVDASDISLCVPREGADDQVKLVRWLVPAGTPVRVGQPVVEIETSKATIEVEAHRDGPLTPLVAEGERVDVGAPIARIGEGTTADTDGPGAPKAAGGPVISRKAQALIDRHGIDLARFAGAASVRAEDVEALLAERGEGEVPGARRFGGEPLDPAADWDAVLARADVGELGGLLEALRRRMRARFDRHVPLGTLVHDRWALARELGFGEGTSIYAESLVLGEVKVGRECWIGPYTVLDGAAAPLTLGDYTQVGTGAQLYTHNTIERTLTGHVADPHVGATSIGRCCFISPSAIVGPGTRIGDHSFVAAQSFVQGHYPSHSFIAGNPARRVGRVVLRDGRAILERDGDG